MPIKVVFFVWLIGLTGAAFGQPLAEKSALNQLEKQRWDRGKAKLSKILRKDTANVAARYGMALYFVAHENQAFNIDSAYFNIIKALHNFSQTPAKERDKLKRIPVDSIILTSLRERIDSLGFERAKQINTEQAYNNFLQQFASAQQRSLALELRDEVAYLDALRENTYQAFDAFLKKYPQARQATEALKRYERLLFEARTKDKQLSSYEAFIKAYPHSPHRDEAEQQVFEIMTASGEPASFRAFLQKYERSKQAARARNILYHLVREQGSDNIMLPLLMTDSLKVLTARNEPYLVPVILDNKKFGFMDASGTELLTTQAATIDEGYLCGNIVEDILVVDNRIINRMGHTVYSGVIDEIEDLGSGFLYIIGNGCDKVLHKSGFQVGGDCVDDAFLLSSRYLAIKKDTQWSVFSLAGRLLLASAGEQLREFHDVVGFQKKGKWSLVQAVSIGGVAGKQKLTGVDGLDDVKEWPQQHIWVRKGNDQGILDNTLSYVVPLSAQKLEPMPVGIQATSSAGVRLYDWKANPSAFFLDVMIRKPWVSVKTAEGWRLYDLTDKKFLSDGYDTIAFEGLFGLAHRHDTVRVFFNKEKWQDFHDAQFEFLPTRDSTSLLVVTTGETKTVYNGEGSVIITLACDKIQYAGSGYFIFSKREKKGLVDGTGKQVLPADYDAIGEVEGSWIPLLRKMKFGMWDTEKKKEIKPMYDKNLRRYSQDWIVAFRDGHYGFITTENKAQGAFEFEDIVYWNDSAALVKKDRQWMVMNIQDRTVLLDRIKRYSLISETSDEKIVLINQDNARGVVSSRRGIIIPPTFTDIVNIGSVERPLYFTEKHVEEAYIFVVIYYDQDGKLIRRQAFTDEEYERIYCAQN